MKEYSCAAFIGRFQPFHHSHRFIIKTGLEIAEKVVIVIGSSNASSNIKNPFTAHERVEMIRACFTEKENENIAIECVRDYYYSDHVWMTDIQAKISKHAKNNSVVLLGNYKDGSSWYLTKFPQWDFHTVKAPSDGLNSTAIRDILFDIGFFKVDRSWRNDGRSPYLSLLAKIEGLPNPVSEWIDKNFISSDRHKSLITEYEFIHDYKKRWSLAPFPPTFVTVDCVVVCSGHVLLVKRKFEPGKGLLAMPGGFIRTSEKLEDAALRELKEETGIKVDKQILRSSILETKVFDHPDRSLRGRTITHAFYIRLKDGDLPEVSGGDDAETAQWHSLMDVGHNEPNFYEDHFHVIQYFLNRS